jgi:hypothetical protein
MQQHYRGPYPWGEPIAEPDDVRQEREERERRGDNCRHSVVGTLWYTPHRDGRPGGTVTPHPPTRAVEPQPTRSAEPERIKLPPKVRAELNEKFGEVAIDRALEELGGQDKPEATPLQREATSIEEAGHGVQAATLGLRAADAFVTKVGSGQYRCADLGPILKSNHGWRDTAIRVISFYLAGQIAQRIKYGRPVVTGHKNDNDNIDRYLIVAGDERAAVLAEAERFTEQSLRARWSEVERIAAALRERGSLTGEEFEALLDKPAAVQTRTASVPMMIRSATVSPASNHEIDLVWTTGAAVRRVSFDGPYDEVLLTGESNVRLGRLNAGAPLLNSHDSSDLSRILGSVVPGSAKMVNGQGIARIKLSARAEVAGLVQDIVSGVIRNASVGYRYHRVERDNTGDIPVWRVTDWEPLEVSAVAVGADGLAQFRDDARFDCEVRG